VGARGLSVKKGEYQMGLMELVVALIIIGVAFWAMQQLSGAFGIPAPIVTVIQVIMVIFVIVYLLQGLGVSGPVLRIR
jgi:uncharacterized membrane protein YwzB